MPNEDPEPKTCPSARLLDNQVSHFNEDFKDHQQILLGCKTKHTGLGPKAGYKKLKNLLALIGSFLSRNAAEIFSWRAFF